MVRKEEKNPPAISLLHKCLLEITLYFQKCVIWAEIKEGTSLVLKKKLKITEIRLLVLPEISF